MNAKIVTIRVTSAQGLMPIVGVALRSWYQTKQTLVAGYVFGNWWNPALSIPYQWWHVF